MNFLGIKFGVVLVLLTVLLLSQGDIEAANGQWYYSGNAVTDKVVRTDTSIEATNNTARGNFGIIYFDKISLEVGESLVVTFSAKLSVEAALFIVRAGLYNSGGKDVDGDNRSANNSIYSDYRGYTMGVGSDAMGKVSPLRLYVRDLSSNSLITTAGATSLGDIVTRPARASVKNVLSKSDTYYFKYIVKRTGAEEVSVSFSVNDDGGSSYSSSWNDLKGNYAVYEFDAFAFGMGNNTDWTSFSVTDLKLDTVPVLK